MDYTAWNFTQEDNFCRVDLDHKNHCLRVIPISSDGCKLKQGSMYGDDGRPLESKLTLAPW